MEAFLLCPPDYFDVQYSINPWMTGDGVDHKAAINQWNNLYRAITEAGGVVKTIDPVKGLPDMVFTANSGTVYNNTVVMSRMQHKERQKETKHFRKWFDKNEYSIIELMPGISFEGCGDVVIHDEYLIGGHGFRSDQAALKIVANTLGLKLIDLKLIDPRFYHLDTCFCKVSNGSAIYFPGAFNKQEIDKLKGIIDLIPVDEAEARQFICNSMMVNDTLLIPVLFSKTGNILKNNYGIKVRHVGTQEFLKSGGSIQCLCLKI